MERLIWLVWLVIGISLAESLPELEFPLVQYGVGYGDCRVPTTTDGSGSPTNFKVPFPYFGINETKIYVNTNGILSFQKKFHSFAPKPFEYIVIAPFWHDSNINRFGRIYYRVTTDAKQFPNLQEVIRRLFCIDDFEITQLFVATYENIAAYINFNYTHPLEGYVYKHTNPQASNTFQVILVTNGELSFVFFSYGDIEWGFNANIGFNSRNRSFTVPGALTINTIDVETTSNVGVAGLHVYRVDQENITEPLYKVCRGSGSGCVQLNLTSKVIPATITSKVPVLIGDNITLTCSYNHSISLPDYKFTWMFNGSILPEDTPILVLTAVTENDLGEYVCMIEGNDTMGCASIIIYSRRDTMEKRPYKIKVSTNCPPKPNRENILRETFHLLVDEFIARPFGQIKTYPAASCDEIRDTHPELESGFYWISPYGEPPVQMYCNL